MNIVRKSASRSSLIKDPETLRAGRERMVEVALSLFLESGFHQTSVRAIAEGAGVSVGTLFNYFTGKDELLLHLITVGQDVWERPMQPLRAEIDDAIARGVEPEEVLTTLVSKYVQMTNDTRRYVLLAYQETKSLVSSARREIFDRERRLVAIFERTLRYGTERSEWPKGHARIKAHSIVMLCQTWALRRWFLLREVSNVDEYRQELIPIVLSIARSPSGEAARGESAVRESAIGFVLLRGPEPSPAQGMETQAPPATDAPQRERRRVQNKSGPRPPILDTP